MRSVDVALASTSRIKLDAVASGFDAVGFAARVRAFPARSSMPEQPVGFDEIVGGARNRLAHLRAAGAKCVCIAIENGVVPMTGPAEAYQDLAAVIICLPDRAQALVYSAGLGVPAEAVREARRRSCGFGAILAERHGSDPKDPHLLLTGGRFSRRTILGSAVSLAILSLGESRVGEYSYA